MTEELNEDCGCQSSADNIRTYTQHSNISKYNPDPLVGKRVNLVDGRSGLVDDSIRNNTGEVIGYVIEGDKGKYRVFSNKISGTVEEGAGAFASLTSTPGMGNVKPPMPDGTPGSGDKFGSLTVGTPAAKKKDQKKQPNPLSTSLMDFKSFLKSSKKNQ